MNMTSQELVTRFIETRDTIRAAFRLENEYVYPLCAQIFLAADRPVEAERLDRCKALVKGSTGPFSNFRGNIKLPLICMLAVWDGATGLSSEERWDRAQRYYALLKETFFGSEFLALGALLLTDAAKEEDMPALAARGKELYKRMRKEHPFLTGQEDSVFALLLAQSERSDDELVTDMEACYSRLNQRFPKGNGAQTASHVLALSTADPEAKVDRLIQLFDTLRAAGCRYGRETQLPILAALSMGQGDVDSLSRELVEIDGLLAAQKGYRGVFSLDRKTRAMHAAMLLSLLHGPEPAQKPDVAGAAAQQATLAMIVAQQALMCAVIASSAASSAAAASH